MSSLHSPEKKHHLLTKILKRFKVFPSSVGCLGVQESSGLGSFSEIQSTRGTVNDKQQLTAMKELYATSKLYAHSLLSFRFPTKLQLIYALDSQFEGVGGLKNREKVLKKCFDHLEPFGLLIFDLSMPKSFNEKDSGQELKISENEVSIIDTSIKKGLLSKKRIRFVMNEQGSYDRYDETTKQQLLSLADLKKLLKGFETVEFLDHNGRKANSKTKHVVVVVQKGW